MALVYDVCLQQVWETPNVELRGSCGSDVYLASLFVYYQLRGY